jgi:hypothetical protein
MTDTPANVTPAAEIPDTAQPGPDRHEVNLGGDPKEWTVALRVGSVSEAEVAKATLGFAGIPAMVYGETGLGAAYGLLPMGIAGSEPVGVMVPAERLAEAVAVIEETKAAAARATLDEASPETLREAVAEMAAEDAEYANLTGAVPGPQVPVPPPVSDVPGA